METIRLFISVPVASFRVPRAREYFETFPVPPPATVYGMLLSMIGEVNRRVYEGVDVAIGLLSKPAYSTVLRTLWRVKNKKDGLGLGVNRRPDFQELLTDVRLLVWVRNSVEAESNLVRMIRSAFDSPYQINRFGGLCLGESTHLIDEIKVVEKPTEGPCRLLVKSDDGEFSLPIWADHVGSADTSWGQFTFQEVDFENSELIDQAWVKIQRKPLISPN